MRRKLLCFVQEENATGQSKIRVSCAHTTPDEDAQALLEEVIEFFEQVLSHKLPIVSRGIERGEEHFSFYRPSIQEKELAVVMPAYQLWRYDTYVRNR